MSPLRTSKCFYKFWKTWFIENLFFVKLLNDDVQNKQNEAECLWNLNLQKLQLNTVVNYIWYIDKHQWHLLADGKLDFTASFYCPWRSFIYFHSAPCNFVNISLKW